MRLTGVGDHGVGPGRACALWAWTSGGLALEGAIETYSAYYSMRGTWWNLPPPRRLTST